VIRNSFLLLYLILTLYTAQVVFISLNRVEKLRRPASENTDSLIEAIIGEHNPSRIEEFLSLLPKEYFKNYTLVHTSKSIQGADYLRPRVILFSSDGTSYLTFNGDHTQTGGEALEMMSFKEESKKFVFREVLFKSGQPAMISQTNPNKCLSCHGQDPKPIWDSYKIWNGVYGRHDDLMETSDLETEQFKEFKQKAQLHPRYKYLHFDSQNALSPYSAREALTTHLQRPNTRLTKFFVQLNATRIYEKVRTHPSFTTYFNLLLSGATGCYQGFKPKTKALADKLVTKKSAHRNLTGKHQDIFWTLSASLGLEPTDWSLALTQNDGQHPFHHKNTQDGSSTSGRYLAGLMLNSDSEKATGVKKYFREVTYYESNLPVYSFTTKEEVESWRSHDKIVVPILFETPDENLKACAILEDEVVKEVSLKLDYSVDPHPEKTKVAVSAEAGRAIVINRCSVCHSQPTNPYIPFEDESALSGELKKKRRKLKEKIFFRISDKAPASRRMPRGSSLDEGEQESIRLYLKSLK
jgi:hypothetical protein